MSEITLVTKTMEVGKESSEVADNLKELILDIRAGKNVAAIIAENIPGVMKSIDGFEQLDDEMKDASMAATIAYILKQIAEALTQPVEKVE